MRTMQACALLTTLLISACADPSGDDLDDAVDISGKADAVSFAGTYARTGGVAYKGDLQALQLDADGNYVRLRCYTTNCTATTPEADQFHVLESASTGKKYLAFERFEWTDRDAGESRQLTVDTYEVRPVTGGGIELRKAYTSRWFTLETRTQQAVCTASGGTWNAQTDFDGAAAGTTTHCNCGQDPNMWPSPQFVPGAGGCRMGFAIGEDACDETEGAYTDDDRDMLGDYCRCPATTRPTDTGCVSL
jgi:hypothetical protein